MRQYAICVLLLFVSFVSAETEPDSFSHEAQERKKYLDPGVGVQDHFINEALTKEFCDFILSTAPQEIVDKIKLMANPICPVQLKPKRIILVGPSGSGKTTLAQVMGYLSFRPVVFINAGMLGNEFKNSAVQNLRRAIEPYINSSCVIILDEIDCLLKQSQHEKNPDADLPKQVWEMFDICAQFPGVTLIGITNDISGMPDPIKTRLAGDIIEVPMIDSLERRKEIFDYYLNKLVHGCDKNDVSSIARITKKLSHRELEKVVIEAYAVAFLRDQMYPKIKIEDLETAYEKVQKSRKLLNQINWKKYEKPFQYGIQISGVLVSCIGIAVSTYMAALSLKVSKDAYVLGQEGLEYTKHHGQVTIEKAEEYFKKNQALTLYIAIQAHFSQKIQGVAHTFWQHYDNGVGYLKLRTESVYDPELKKKVEKLTPLSAAAEKYYEEGWDTLKTWGQVGFNKLVEEEIDKLIQQKK